MGVSNGRLRGPGLQGPILCGSLIQAVRSESEIAVAYHWGVSTSTVTKWRRALEVPAVNNGTRALYIGYAYERLVTPENKAKTKEATDCPEFREKIRAASLGRPIHPKTAAALLEAARRPKTEEWKRGQSARSRKMWENPEEYGLPAQHDWSDEDRALLGTISDKAVGEALGLPVHVVVYKRRSLGIEASVLEPWRDDEIRLLGTNIDSEVARTLGRSLSSVRTKRLRLGIPPCTSSWTDEEIALLGSETDREISRRLGRSSSNHPKKTRGTWHPGLSRSLDRGTTFLARPRCRLGHRSIIGTHGKGGRKTTEPTRHPRLSGRMSSLRRGSPGSP